MTRALHLQHFRLATSSHVACGKSSGSCCTGQGPALSSLALPIAAALWRKTRQICAPLSVVGVWAPWNLEMGDHACLSEGVDCYCVEKIRIGAHSTVSQYSFLCTASHDHHMATMPLVAAPITIGERVWITADVFVGPGVTIGDGAVVTARSSCVQRPAALEVVAGNPTRVVGQ